MEIFLFRREQQEGPYKLEQIQEMLSSKELTLADQAWHEGLDNWVSLSDLIAFPSMPSATVEGGVISNTIETKVEQLDSALNRFCGDEQDPIAVAKLVTKAKDLLTSGEQIEYIAIQKKPIFNIAPDGILLTNKRLMIICPKLMGMSFQDYIWRDIVDIHMSEQILTATITCKVAGGIPLKIESIPKKQARKIYAIAQEKEERVREERRARNMEEKRAAAGGITIASPSHQPSTVIPQAKDPVAVLGKLKSMLDSGLILPEEYEAKKSEILGRM